MGLQRSLADDSCGMTAAAPSPSEGRRPLGEVLVEREIVTHEQLAIALEQQRATGQQLGEIIVGLGFAPGPIVAQALATQHGGLIKTEYGFATGWSADAPAEPVGAPPPSPASELADRDRTIAELRAWATSAQTAITARDDVIAQLRAELAAQKPAPDPAVDVGAHEAALEALRAELAATLEQHAAEIARLEAAGTDLVSTATAREAELADAREAQATAAHELASARRTRDELERRLENARSRADTLARRIAEQEEELGALRARPRTAPGRWASAPMHYVLRRGARGYDLVAHDGPPPAVGESVDGLRVARVAPAGPGLDVPCVYLAD